MRWTGLECAGKLRSKSLLTIHTSDFPHRLFIYFHLPAVRCANKLAWRLDCDGSAPLCVCVTAAHTQRELELNPTLLVRFVPAGPDKSLLGCSVCVRVETLDTAGQDQMRLNMAWWREDSSAIPSDYLSVLSQRCTFLISHSLPSATRISYYHDAWVKFITQFTSLMMELGINKPTEQWDKLHSCIHATVARVLSVVSKHPYIRKVYMAWIRPSLWVYGIF